MADTYSYTSPDLAATLSALSDQLGSIGTGHVANKKWYRKYDRWADYWRDNTQAALFGLNGGPATDPLANLQSQLLNQYNNNTAQYNPNYDLSGMVNARNQGTATALRERASQMGVQGAFNPAIDAASRARQTLVNQSMAAYRPLAYQAQQQWQNQQDQLLQSITSADFEAQKSVAGAGRSA